MKRQMSTDLCFWELIGDESRKAGQCNSYNEKKKELTIIVVDPKSNACEEEKEEDAGNVHMDPVS